MGNALETMTDDRWPITSPRGVLSRLRLVAVGLMTENKKPIPKVDRRVETTDEHEIYTDVRADLKDFSDRL